MRYLTILASAAILSTTATASSALELGFIVTPDSNHVSVTAEKVTKGNITFTIQRDYDAQIH